MDWYRSLLIYCLLSDKRHCMSDTAYYPISTDIPPPILGSGRRSIKYPYAKLRIGESFFAHVGAIDTTRWRRLTGNQYTQRKVVENGAQGNRIWRIA
jgi:hypothetical protein